MVRDHLTGEEDCNEDVASEVACGADEACGVDQASVELHGHEPHTAA